jgi:lipopolysaccharide exporter
LLYKELNKSDHTTVSVKPSAANKFHILTLRILQRSSFVRNVTVLGGGTALSQVVVALTLPILTRLYLPEDFGVLAVYTSIITIVTAFISLQYEQAIVLPKEPEDAASLLLLAMGIVGSISSIAFIIIALFGPAVVILLDDPEVTPWLWLIPISLLTTGLDQVFTFWLIRKKAFSRLAAIRLTQTFVTVGSQLGATILLNLGAGGLISGLVLGEMAAVIVQGWYIWQEDRSIIQKGVDWGRMKSQANEYKKYPLFSSWMFSLDRLQTSMPILFLSTFYGSAIAGSYSMAMRILYIPSNLIGRAVSRVFFQTVAEEKAQTGKVSHLVERAFGWLCLIGVFYLVGMLFGSFFFKLVLGPKWDLVGGYARILAPSFALMFAVSTISFLLGALNKQELEALWQITALVVTAIFLGTSLLFQSSHITLYMLTINNLIVYSFYAFLIFRAAEASFRRSLFFWRIK